MTTLMIDDELSERASRAAAAQGKTLDQFVRDVLSQAINGVTVSLTVRNGLPVMHVSPATPIDPQVIERALSEEGF